MAGFFDELLESMEAAPSAGETEPAVPPAAPAATPEEKPQGSITWSKQWEELYGPVSHGGKNKKS